MFAPRQQARSLDDIVSDVLAVIGPQRAPLRVLLLQDIDRLQALAQSDSLRPPLPAGELKRRLHDYLGALREAKRKFVRWPLSTDERQKREQFLVMLDEEIKRVATEHDNTSVRRSGKQADRVAKAAIQCAAFYLSVRWRTVNATGAWHRLSVLFYEAATREAKDLMHYLRKMDPRSTIRSESPGGGNRFPLHW
jgi:hypothetical protein